MLGVGLKIILLQKLVKVDKMVSDWKGIYWKGNEADRKECLKDEVSGFRKTRFEVMLETSPLHETNVDMYWMC